MIPVGTRFGFGSLILLFVVSTIPLNSGRAELIPSIDNANFGWVRGAPNSTFSGWDVFNNETPALTTILDSTPELPGQFGVAATLRETSGSGIVLGSGNIYGLSGVTTFVVDQPGLNLGPSAMTRVVAQFQTLGNELRYDSIRLSGIGFANVPPTFTQELSRSSFGMPGQPGSGANVVYLAGWDVAQNVGDYSLSFASSASAMSLARFNLDTFANVTAVPEPASVAMVSMIVIGWGIRRVRQKNRFR
jgi:hypothetical protein